MVFSHVTAGVAGGQQRPRTGGFNGDAQFDQLSLLIKCLKLQAAVCH